MQGKNFTVDIVYSQYAIIGNDDDQVIDSVTIAGLTGGCRTL